MTMLIVAIVFAGVALLAFVIIKQPQLSVEQRAEILFPVAYVILRRVGPAPDVGSVGVIGSRTEQARAFAGWAAWRYGPAESSDESRAWSIAIARAREQINDEWSPSAGDVVIGVIAAVGVLVTTALGVVTGGASAVAGLVGYGAYIGRTVQAADAQKEALARSGARYARALAGEARRIAWEVRVFVSIFQRQGFPQPTPSVLGNINRVALESVSMPFLVPRWGTEAEQSVWRAELLRVADANAARWRPAGAAGIGSSAAGFTRER